MKTFASLAFFTLVSAASAFAASTCHTEGDATIQAIVVYDSIVSDITSGPADGYDKTERFTKGGNELGTTIGHVDSNGMDLVFNGRPPLGGLAFGAYPSWDGSMVEVWTSIEFSTNWQPEGREVCTKHITVLGHGRKCVEKGIEYFPTSFIVDYTTDSGATLHYTKSFPISNNANHYTIFMPRLHCDGPVNNFETRVRDLNGGSGEFRIHNIKYKSGWKF